MVSMKDISSVCRVSVATVSKALNGHSDVGAETKAHIVSVARELGYFPNSAARALKTNRTHNLGVLFVDEARSGLTHDYFSYVLDSFKRTAEERAMILPLSIPVKPGSRGCLIWPMSGTGALTAW